MKHKSLIPIAIGIILCFDFSYGQNIAVNTSGTAAAATHMFEVTQTSTAANMVAIYAIHSGATAGTGYGLYATKTGASTTNIAGYFNASGGTSNYALIVPNSGGYVGIGTTTPLWPLDISYTISTASVNARGGIFQPTFNSSGDGPGGLSSQPLFSPTANLSVAYGLIGTATANPPAGVTISNVNSGHFRFDTKAGSAGIVSAANVIQVAQPNLLGIIPTNIYGINIANQGAAGITTSYGLYVAAQSGATNSYGGIFLGGNVGIGTSTPGSKLQVYNSDPTISVNIFSQFQPTLVANQASNLHASWHEIDASSTFNFNCSLWGAVNRINVLVGQTGLVANTYGSVNDSWHYGTGTITNATGSSNQIVNTSTGTITNAFGIYSVVSKQGTGAITNGYGLYIDYVQATNKWGIYENDNSLPNYIAGKLGIANTAPTYPLDVSGNARVTGDMYLGNCGFWLASTWCSDIRLKKDICPITNSLEKILQLQGVNYYFKVEEFPQKHLLEGKQIGLIAQDVGKIYPEVVWAGPDGFENIHYDKLVPILIEAIKEQQKIIDGQKIEIQNLKTKFDSFEASLKSLQLQINSSAKK